MTVFLHGFWGSPRDWAPIAERVPLQQQLWIPDLYVDEGLTPEHDLHKWTTHFLHELNARTLEPAQLVGYSMGGRLALQALHKAPERFSRALILSANPYLEVAEHSARAKWEQGWSHRFANEPWEQLETAWQEQEIFRGSSRQPHRQSESLRALLGLSLERWSVRHHLFTREDVRTLPKYVDWAFGALDQKYLGIAKSLQELPIQGQIAIVPQCGHRLLFEATDYVANWLS